MNAIASSLKAGVLGVALSFCAVSAQANLISNGSFEDNQFGSGLNGGVNGWDYFASADVPGWDGSNIELWDSSRGVAVPDGNYFAELNSHPGGTGGTFSIYQNFSTVVGQWYDLSFAYSARNNNGNESFKVDVAGISWLINDHVQGVWSEFTDYFQATDTITKLMFTTVSPLGTEGNFLDSVIVTARVPEPGTLALFALGLLGLGYTRRKTV